MDSGTVRTVCSLLAVLLGAVLFMRRKRKMQLARRSLSQARRSR